VLKKLLLAVITLFIINGCGGISYLAYNSQQLIIQLDENQLVLKGTLLDQKRDSFSSLYLTQNIIRLNEGELVVYEDARTDLDYEFEPMITRSIKTVFEANRIIVVYTKNHLFAYQLLLTNGKLLNVIAQQGDTQHLKFVYGMSTTQLNKMLKQLDPNANKAYYKQVMKLQNAKDAILSKWDVQKVHFVPLVVPLPRFMGRM
jgi:hypothetical protein